MSAVADCKHGKPVTLCTRCLAPHPTWRPSRKAVLIAVYAYYDVLSPFRGEHEKQMRRALQAAWRADHPGKAPR